MCMTTDADVIVVGAGLAGLAAAATARQAGRSVVVIEAHHAGGRARTVERDGFTLNMGAHALYRLGEGAKVLSRLGVTPAGAAPPLDRYRALVGGRLHALPTGPGTLLRTRAVGPRSKVQLISLLGRLNRIRTETLHHTSVAEWLAGYHLGPDAESVVRALLRLSTYSDDVELLSAGAGLGQLQLATRGGVLYLHGGWRQLVDGLARTLDVRTGVEVLGLDQRGNGVEVRTTMGTLTAPRVVVATGGPDALRRILPADPGWGRLGPPVTAACLDLGLSRVPEPGYVLSRRPALRHRAIAPGPTGGRARRRAGRHPLRGPQRGSGPTPAGEAVGDGRRGRQGRGRPAVPGPHDGERCASLGHRRRVGWPARRGGHRYAGGDYGR